MSTYSVHCSKHTLSRGDKTGSWDHEDEGGECKCGWWWGWGGCACAPWTWAAMEGGMPARAASCACWRSRSSSCSFFILRQCLRISLNSNNSNNHQLLPSQDFKRKRLTARTPLRPMPLHAHMRVQMVQRPIALRAPRPITRIQPLDLIIPPPRSFLHLVPGQRHERIRLRVLVRRARAHPHRGGDVLAGRVARGLVVGRVWVPSAVRPPRDVIPRRHLVHAFKRRVHRRVRVRAHMRLRVGSWHARPCSQPHPLLLSCAPPFRLVRSMMGMRVWV